MEFKQRRIKIVKTMKVEKQKPEVPMPYIMGHVLATVISWDVNHSILWAMLQGFFSWFYVIYYAITRLAF
jgi:hypothetical protein